MMRKIIVFITAIFLFSLAGLFFSNKIYAVCQINVQPPAIQKNFNDKITITNQNNCFRQDTYYKIVAYPKDVFDSLKSVYDFDSKRRIFRKPAISEEVKSADEKTLTANLNFNSTDTRFTPPNLGPWNLLICLTIGDIQKCDKDPVAMGIIFVGPLAPTPTPTPQPDQPTINYSDQTQCRFQYTENKDFNIPIVVTIPDATKTYQWWWDDKSAGKNQRITPDPTNTTNDPTSLNYDPDNPTYLQTLIWADMIQKLDNPTRKKGHLYCVDVEEKKRNSTNCIRLFFHPGQPPKDTSCSLENAGDATPPLIAPLPQCAIWAFLDGTPVPEPQEQYIKDNNPEVKCIEVATGVGPIKTDPFDFVKSILSILLSLAGGIAVILIIISGYRLMTSQGNPETVQAARDQLTSAIVGLLFIIFSLVILQVIGVDILRIPGFER